MEIFKIVFNRKKDGSIAMDYKTKGSLSGNEAMIVLEGLEAVKQEITKKMEKPTLQVE